MEHRLLGKDGPQVPVLGLGAWPLAGGMGSVDEKTAISTVHAAIDNGITLVDTAQSYNNSEALLGKALKSGYRNRCFLATKVSRDYSPQGIRAAIENSLSQLQVDYVDLYQIHGWNPAYPIAESMRTMAQLQAEGKARYLGVSNFNAQQMAEALQTARFQSTQPLYNLVDRGIEAEDIPFCEHAGIGILAYSPLAKGMLTGKHSLETEFPADDERSRISLSQGERKARYLQAAKALDTVARDKGISLVQLAIAWTLRLPAITCTLVGAKHPDQVLEHVGATQVKFTPDELARIDEIGKGIQA
ncbi:MAG: aldo/keto reductase [Chloroflexi bacterium]|nr:aldo/keto reductase [Chloroflexota bacterium]